MQRNLRRHAAQRVRRVYVADLKVSRDGRSLIDVWPETVQPEWRTPEQAIRDGVERARRAIR
ncbi:MAG TPA: DUF6566 family protein [Vicinamibacterales bacterium]|nr:DUF6566 family protein [Vicinamibacterales bacterium]